MNKSLVMCGVAALALASCTQNEVLEVNDSRAIGFNSFVGNNTRAVVEVTKLTDFYVFANFGTGGSYDGVAYKNESMKQTYYWADAGNVYRFGTYANGDAGKLTDAEVSFAPATGTNGTLTFTGYAPQAETNDGKDLVAAVASHTVDGTENAETKVNLTFQHLLSQVKFTFKTTDADTYTLKIHNLKINGAVSKATCTYDGTTTWNTSDESVEKNGYAYDEITDIAVAPDYQGSSVETVIPQSGTDALTVTFTATISGGGMTEKTANFTANLGYTAPAEGEPATTNNTWTPGYRYNYIATINADQIDPELEDQKINFEVIVDGWENANDTTINPTTPQP